MIKQTKGITLIALVITIIILLILAGLSISSLTGSGLFQKAQEATRLSEIKEIEEIVRISYMEKQMEEVASEEQATMAGVISDLREKGYTIKEITGGTNSVTGVKLSASEISMGKNSTEEITYEYEYASGTTIRYFVEVQEKNYEILFNNGEIIVSTIETDLENIDKLPEITVTSSNNEIVETQKTEEGKITITSKEKGGEVTITVTCAGKIVTCKVTIELFIGLDKNDTNPTGAMPDCEIEIVEKDALEGIVIKDEYDNEWVWIEVPKSEFKIANALKDKSEEKLNDAIKLDLENYAHEYRNGKKGQSGDWEDIWYNGCGIESPEKYDELYNKMLNSIYINGGFWISRYEIGDSDATKNKSWSGSGMNGNPVSMASQVPFGNVTVGDAQKVASNMGKNIGMESSLLFGIQWDLVCKYLEVNANWDTTVHTASYYINEDSNSWGNYQKSGSWMVTSMNAMGWDNQNYKWYDVSYGTTVSRWVYTTGISNRHCKMNIYDFAGNYYEWTLEYSGYSSQPAIVRGGETSILGSFCAAYRKLYYANKSMNSWTFRVALY